MANLLSHKEKIIICCSHMAVVIFVVFMVGTLLHYYIPIEGSYGIHIEGVMLGAALIFGTRKCLSIMKDGPSENC